MKKIKLLFAIGLTLSLLGFGLQVSAHDPHICPAEFPDEPAIEYGHLDQSQIADGEVSLDTVVTVGKEWFDAVLNYCDGQGRPATTGGGAKRTPTDQPAFIRTSAPDSSSCADCHSQPRSGGGGGFVANVFVLAQTMDPVVDTVSGEFSNERNTLGMFGSGPIEMLAREITAELHAIRAATIQEAQTTGSNISRELLAKGISYGFITAAPDGTVDTSAYRGVDDDLIIKPFHQAGVVISLREFTVNAYNHHHGLQAEERFDLDPNKGIDYDEDGMAREMTIGDVTAATLYQATLGVPGQVLPLDEAGQTEVALGQQLFVQVGCAHCHTPELHLDSQMFTEPNPYNPAGTWSDTAQTVSFNMTGQGEGPFLEPSGDGAIVRAYTDLKRHNLCDDPAEPDAIRHFCNEQLAQNRPDIEGKAGSEYFLTRKLWDVGNSAPYGHRGDLPTITEAIWAHGGEGRPSYEAFKALDVNQQSAVIKFLKTLQVLPAGSPRIIFEDGTQPASTDNGTGGLLAGSTFGEAGSSSSNLLLILAIAAVFALIAIGSLSLYQRRKVN